MSVCVSGFFVKTVVSRWWSQYTRLPWPDSAALQLHGLVLFDEKEEEALQFVHTVMRYMVLSYVLSVRRISKVLDNSPDLKDDIDVAGRTKHFPW